MDLHADLLSKRRIFQHYISHIYNLSYPFQNKFLNLNLSIHDHLCWHDWCPMQRNSLWFACTSFSWWHYLVSMLTKLTLHHAYIVPCSNKCNFPILQNYLLPWQAIPSTEFWFLFIIIPTFFQEKSVHICHIWQSYLSVPLSVSFACNPNYP